MADGEIKEGGDGMTSKEFLSQAFHIDQRINSKLEQIAALRSLATKTNRTLSATPGNPNKGDSKTEDYIIKIMGIEEEINDDIDRLVDLKAEIMGVIKKVENTDCQLLLEKRYLCFQTWEEIANDLNFSVRNIHVLHSKALGMVKVPE